VNAHPLAPIPDADVDAFWRDGVICLRGLFDADWIEHMRDAVEDDLAHPGPLAREYATKAGQRFLGDIGAWAVKPGLRRYVEESPAAEIAARMLKSRKVNFLYDQLFVKEPGTAAVTPWHQDGPYWPVKGDQILSIWLALDDVTVESSGVEYIKGSHRWGREFRPVHFGGDTEAYKMLPGETLPDIDALRKAPGNTLAIVNWDMKAGDCLLHHCMTVHGAPGNASSTQRRRAYATRWTGDDVVYAPRTGQASITIDTPTCSPGEPIDCAVFPRLWPRRVNS
jgi:ectoine hydroxylase-related dioxygenase (phytanoyl-CoA dioxygenase family)